MRCSMVDQDLHSYEPCLLQEGHSGKHTFEMTDDERRVAMQDDARKTPEMPRWTYERDEDWIILAWADEAYGKRYYRIRIEAGQGYASLTESKALTDTILDALTFADSYKAKAELATDAFDALDLIWEKGKSDKDWTANDAAEVAQAVLLKQDALQQPKADQAGER